MSTNLGGKQDKKEKNGPLVVASHTSILGTDQAAKIEIQPVKVSFMPKVNIRYFATLVMNTVKAPEALPLLPVQSRAWCNSQKQSHMY